MSKKKGSLHSEFGSFEIRERGVVNTLVSPVPPGVLEMILNQVQDDVGECWFIDCQRSAVWVVWVPASAGMTREQVGCYTGFTNGTRI